ncbi:MAG TPA: hypothetical protein VE621_14445 [Bryobacteraceae bacterium]|jgi:hypothetical protein|nr:hypothetical protein [Bryobacteraceae bacterium]
MQSALQSSYDTSFGNAVQVAERHLTQHERRVWILSVVIAAVALLLHLMEPYARVKPVIEPFTLEANDADGRMRVEWNPASPEVHRATAGRLEVKDGIEKFEFPIDEKVLKSGKLDYLRKSGDVLLSVTLFHNSERIASSSVRSVGP